MESWKLSAVLKRLRNTVIVASSNTENLMKRGNPLINRLKTVALSISVFNTLLLWQQSINTQCKSLAQALCHTNNILLKILWSRITEFFLAKCGLNNITIMFFFISRDLVKNILISHFCHIFCIPIFTGVVWALNWK